MEPQIPDGTHCLFSAPVRLEFPILSLHPGLRPRCVAPDVWARRVTGGGAAAIVEEAGRHAGRLTGGTPCASGGWRCRCGGRPAGYWDHGAPTPRPTANRLRIGRSSAAYWPFIDCEGGCTHVAAPFADPFLRGDVTVTYDHVQPRLARRPPRARLRGGAVHQAEGRRGARGDGAGRVRAPAGRLRRLRQRGDELIPDRYVRRSLASWYGAHSTGSLPLAASRSTAPSSPRPTTICRSIRASACAT